MNPLYENEFFPKPQTVIMPSDAFPLHYHRHLEVICVMEGRMGVQVGDKRYLLSVGDILFAAPYVMHGYTPPPGTRPLLFKAIMDPECLGRAGTLLPEFHPMTPVITADDAERMMPDYRSVLKRLASVGTQISEDDPLAFCTYYADLCAFFEGVLRYVGTERVRHGSSLYLQAVRICYDRYGDPDFRVESIAREIHVSEVRLQQLFAENMDLGVKEYIILLRMNAAESMLSETEMPVADIAPVCGYKTVRSFNRAFLSAHGITPTEYRELYRNAAADGPLPPAAVTGTEKILSDFEQFYRENPSEKREKHNV